MTAPIEAEPVLLTLSEPSTVRTPAPPMEPPLPRVRI